MRLQSPCLFLTASELLKLEPSQLELFSKCQLDIFVISLTNISLRTLTHCYFSLLYWYYHYYQLICNFLIELYVNRSTSFANYKFDVYERKSRFRNCSNKQWMALLVFLNPFKNLIRSFCYFTDFFYVSGSLITLYDCNNSSLNQLSSPQCLI